MKSDLDGGNGADVFSANAEERFCKRFSRESLACGVVYRVLTSRLSALEGAENGLVFCGETATWQAGVFERCSMPGGVPEWTLS